MKKAGKIAIGIIVAILILIGIALYFAWSNLDSLVAGAIEHYGSQATGTSVTVGKVDISLTDGTAELHNLTIGNPNGYQSPYALKLGNVQVDLDISSLTGDTIVVNDGLVDGMSVNAEYKGKQSNVEDILDHVKQFAGPSEPQQQPGGEKKFIVKNFRFTNGAATLMLDAANAEKTLNIPDISVHDIGVESNGVNAAELAKQLLRPVLNRVETKVRSAARQKAEKALQDKKKELEQKARKKLKDKLEGLGGP